MQQHFFKIKKIKKLFCYLWLNSLVYHHKVARMTVTCDFYSVGDHRPVGRDRIRSQPKNLKTGRDPEKIPVATRNRSRSRKIFRSRPVIGRDPEKSLGRDLDRVEVPNTIIKYKKRERER